jgi:hypothetical protein
VARRAGSSSLNAARIFGKRPSKSRCWLLLLPVSLDARSAIFETLDAHNGAFLFAPTLHNLRWMSLNNMDSLRPLTELPRTYEQ